MSELVTKMSGSDPHPDNTHDSSAEKADRKVILVSLESENFEVSYEIAIQSELVKSMIDVDEVDEVPEIPLVQVKSTTLGKVLEFCMHYSKEPMKKLAKVLTNYSFKC